MLSIPSPLSGLPLIGRDCGGGRETPMSGSGGTREGSVCSDEDDPGRDVVFAFRGLVLGLAGALVAVGPLAFLSTAGFVVLAAGPEGMALMFELGCLGC